jgi:protein-L-isoaspartate(D-aspartate) O-methyltransferase
MRTFEDSYRHKGMRKKLVDIVRDKGIGDERILEAINKIPRHFFLDSAFDEIAYEDKAFPIDADQTISQPYTVAYQTELLEVKPFMPTYGPFDRVIITAAAPIVPPKLIDQMKVGGMMVIPVDSGELQVMKRITKLEGGELKTEVFDRFSFVPMLQGKNE